MRAGRPAGWKGPASRAASVGLPDCLSDRPVNVRILGRTDGGACTPHGFWKQVSSKWRMESERARLTGTLKSTFDAIFSNSQPALLIKSGKNHQKWGFWPIFEN